MNRAVAPMSRRTLLAGAGVAVAGSGCAAGPDDAAGYDPRRSAEGQIKIAATLDETAAYWTYTGTIYAVQPDKRPFALVTLSGCQVQWAVQKTDASFRMAAQTLTFFRDPDSGAFLDAFANPLTGQRNEVRPNIFAGAARALFPADGGPMRIDGVIAASQSAPQGFAAADPRASVGRVGWTLTADCIVLTTDHAFAAQIQPQMEAQTRTADRAAFFNPRIKRLAARYAATTISPWLGWMSMRDTPGHLVWHTAGEKVFAVDRLPEDYRQRAGALLDQLIAKPVV